MTIPAILERGFQTRHEHGNELKLAYQRLESARRFMLLPWVMEARRIDLRTAHRRWLRRNGRQLRRS